MDAKMERVTITGEIELQPISVADTSKLQQLMFTIYPPIYAHLWIDGGQSYLQIIYSKNNIKQELLNPQSRYFFVLYNKETVGIIKFVLDKNYRKDESKMIKLHRIYLLNTVRGKGVGSILLKWLEREIASGFEEIWLEVMDTQDKAIQFYKKLGYVIVGKATLRSINIKAQFNGMLIMSKRINQK